MTGTGAQLARPDFGVSELNRVARALTNDSDAFSAELLAGQLLFGQLRWQELSGSGDYQNSADVREVALYPNGFRIILVLQLDPEIPLELRPLYCLYDNHFLAGEMPAISGYELTLTTQGSTSLRSSGLHFNHLRWVRLAPGSTALETGVTFSSGELYLDPTELLGVGSRYDAQSDIIILDETAPQSNPLLMLMLYALLCGSSWLLLRRNREYRLRFGIYRWLAVAAIFPLAFIPLSGPLFMVAALLSALWDTARMAQVSQGRKEKRAQVPVLEEIEAPEELIDGSDRQLTDEVLPGERELLDDLLEETTPDALGELAPGEGRLLEGEFEETPVLANRQPEGRELQPLPTGSCPNCDTSVEDDWKACPECGELLDSEALAAAVREASSGAGSAGAGGSEALEAQPVSIDDLLASLDEEDGLPEGEEEEPGEDSGAAGDTNGDVMDELKRKLEELDE